MPVKGDMEYNTTIVFNEEVYTFRPDGKKLMKCDKDNKWSMLKDSDSFK